MNLEFEKAALVRDRIVDLRRELAGLDPVEAAGQAGAAPRPPAKKRRGSVQSRRKVIK